jgi:hypothetical protein
MIPYLGCETVREMLDAFVDGELNVDDQVAVESHLRWCRTCAARVEDMTLIGAAVRMRATPPADPSDTDKALSLMQSNVLTRIRAERAQSWQVRVRELLSDGRLFWPALGATAAVMVCLVGMFAVMSLTFDEQPDSLAALMDTMARPPKPVAHPGSDENPLRLAAGISLPRAFTGGAALDSLSEDEAVFAVATVLTKEGRVADYELLPSDTAVSRSRRRRASAQNDVTAVLDAVRQTRFAPAQRAGQAVAVNMVWLIARTTVKAPPRASTQVLAPVTREPEPVIAKPADDAPVHERSSTAHASAMA